MSNAKLDKNNVQSPVKIGSVNYARLIINSTVFQNVQIILTVYRPTHSDPSDRLGLILPSTTVATASCSTVEGTMRVL